MASDAELLRAAETDSHAFREIYDRHAGRIHAFFTRRTSDGDAALELVAETFAQAWYSRRRLRDHHDGNLAPWLFGIARNVLLRSVRDRKIAAEAVRRLGLTLEPRREQTLPDPHWIWGLDEDIERALADLPAQQRRAVHLRVAHDLSYDAVAAELDCSPVAARIRVSRGLATLRRRLASTRAPGRTRP